MRPLRIAHPGHRRRRDDIVGVVYLKDLVHQTYTLTDGGRSVAVTDAMRPATFVPDLADDLLDEMQRDRTTSPSSSTSTGAWRG